MESNAQGALGELHARETTARIRARLSAELGIDEQGVAHVAEVHAAVKTAGCPWFCSGHPKKHNKTYVA